MKREDFLSLDNSRDGQEAHSRKLDAELGFQIEEVERALLKEAQKLRPDGHLWTLGQGLHDGNQTWIGLDPQVIQTPYSELVEILELLELEDHYQVVDLGAGYGRMGIVLNVLSPSSSFLGLEVVGERVKEGQRIYKKFSLPGTLIEQDLLKDHFRLPIADIYFLYDFGELKHIKSILEQLPVEKKFRLVARGKGSRALIDHKFPWLSDVSDVIRRENFAIYSNL